MWADAGGGERAAEAGTSCEATAVCAPAAGAAWPSSGRCQWACKGGRRDLPLRVGRRGLAGAVGTC